MKSKSRTLLFCYFQITMPKKREIAFTIFGDTVHTKNYKKTSTDEQAIIAKRGQTS